MYETVAPTIYPTIVAVFDRNWPAMYTIAIYGRLYTAKGLSDVNIAKMQMANFFSLNSKVWLMSYAVWLHKCF